MILKNLFSNHSSELKRFTIAVFVGFIASFISSLLATLPTIISAEDIRTGIVESFNVLKDWQTLIAAIFGFVGLIVLHVLNARHSERKIEEERIKELQSVVLALSCEIQLLSDACKATLDHMSGMEDLGLEKVPSPDDLKALLKIPEPVVYRAHIEKIGLLSSEAAKPVVNFYALVDYYNQLISTPEYAKRHLSVLVKALSNSETALKEIQKIL